ncbi:metallophosphoesterase family protein [Rhodothermus profundi]|uniref:3',5'-cyclic AMP phosphodiesterase CpdA n=1 Tax=Rhodothermus profundi TaxID=633813 RepID=A0A1M6STU6_9BACT|nr:metallophosphoesterase [Rhodothermus profundi]SHK48086.1 3',5'-cyclic AMP phosphodiesterase CpdA [Rhodothermus profundi]
MVLVHLSDLHFGRLASDAVVEDLLRAVHRQRPDLVVISGDLTQRARRSQFRAARAFLEALPSPVLVVPGNHDVYPWWYPLSRLVRPLARYRRYISATLRPSFVCSEAAVLGLNTAHGATVKGGRLAAEDLVYMQTFFASAPPSAVRILVVHHHLVPLQAVETYDIARGARKALQVAAQVGVEFILCGHLHVAHVEPVVVYPDGHRLVVVSAGTATSSRGRGPHRDKNFYNVMRLARGSVLITEHCYDPSTRRFITFRSHQFTRETLPDKCCCA